MRRTNTHQRLLGVAEAANRLGISRRLAWALISAGHLPVVRIGAKTIRVDLVDLEAFIDERRERRGA